MAQKKLDLYREYKAEYVTPKKPVLVEVGPAKYLTIEGQGKPGGEAFQAQIGALYGMSFTIKFAKKLTGHDYRVMHLQGLWWPPEGSGDPFVSGQASTVWNWKLLVRVPDFVTKSDLSKAARELRAKGKPQDFERVQLETLREKTCVQLLHVGPYEKERESIQRMADFAHEQGLEFHGMHHEIYLSDPRRVPPERLRTILRHPVHRPGA